MCGHNPVKYRQTDLQNSMFNKFYLKEVYSEISHLNFVKIRLLTLEYNSRLELYSRVKHPEELR